MSDWVDYLSKVEAQAVLDAEVPTRYMARDERGEKCVRYSAPNAAEMVRLRAKAGG